MRRLGRDVGPDGHHGDPVHRQRVHGLQQCGRVHRGNRQPVHVLISQGCDHLDLLLGMTEVRRAQLDVYVVVSKLTRGPPDPRGHLVPEVARLGEHHDPQAQRAIAPQGAGGAVGQESHRPRLFPDEGLGPGVHQPVIVECPAHGAAGNVERAGDVRRGDDAAPRAPGGVTHFRLPSVSPST